jgi:hypothetical protein
VSYSQVACSEQTLHCKLHRLFTLFEVIIQYSNRYSSTIIMLRMSLMPYMLISFPLFDRRSLKFCQFITVRAILHAFKSLCLRIACLTNQVDIINFIDKI